MVTPFFFGNADRVLAGVRHADDRTRTANASATVIVPPLLQEAITTRRCLWWLAEKLAAEGETVLRFDNFGTGDSAGTSIQLTLQGLCDDARVAMEWARERAVGSKVRQVAMRGASIPVLLNASRFTAPVDLVLWDPVLSGEGLVSGWKTLHGRQLTEARRYPFHPAEPEQSDFLGFELDLAFLDALSSFDAANCVLPEGSRLRIATWQVDDAVLGGFVQAQRKSGTDAEILELDPLDRPDWDDKLKFEDQLFPRRSAMRVAELMKELPSWT